MKKPSLLGKNKLVPRLASQVGSVSLAKNLLKKRGDMNTHGELTSKGKKRDNMTAEQRAKDRAVRSTKNSIHTAKDYVYNPKTNAATLKKS